MPDHGPLETVAAAVAGGFDAVGLRVEPKEWTAATTRDTRTALADPGATIENWPLRAAMPKAAGCG